MSDPKRRFDGAVEVRSRTTNSTGDPVFTTRAAMNVWERARVAVVNGWKPQSADPVRLVLDIAKEIERVRAAHAHLLTPESDNG